MIKHSRILAVMARKLVLFLIILLSTSQSQCQTNLLPAGLLCISDCQTCPVICSPPPSPTSPPQTPKLLPPSPPLPLPPPTRELPPSPPVHHYSPPQPYYFTSPSPSSSPPAHPPPPPPPSNSGGGATPPPPSLYVYNPGTTGQPGMGQRNFSYPYYYFYSSKASSHFSVHQGYIALMMFIFFQVLYEY